MNFGKFLIQHGATPRPRRTGFPLPMLGNTRSKQVWDDEMQEIIEVPAGRPERRTQTPAMTGQSGMEILTMEQGTPEWFEARRGLVTASEFSTVLAKGRSGAESKTRTTYMRKLAGEIITNEPMETFSNAHMERGKVMEADARSAYELLRDVEVMPVGFIRDLGLGAGASPDGLVGDHGGVEIKTKLPHLLIECYERGDACPPEHLAQVQGSMWIARRKWWDFVAYWPGMPLFHVRVERDEAYIEELAQEVRAFNAQLARMVGKIRVMA